MTHSFEVVVAGGGPAGMAAACLAAEQGKRVAVVDDNLGPGGQIWRQATTAQKQSRLHHLWHKRFTAAASIQHFYSHRIFDAPESGVLWAEHQGEAVEFRYECLILATGAREVFLPFPGWTLPNVMGVGALQAMAKSGLPFAGKRIVLCGSGPLLLAVAAHLRDQGAKVSAICEQVSWARLARFGAGLLRSPRRLAQALEYKTKLAGTSYRAGTWPVAAKGNTQVESVVVSNGSAQQEFACDYLGCGFHLIPNIELPMLLGCRIEDGGVAVDSLQRTSLENVFCVGELAGIGGVELALLQGEIAGLASAGNLRDAQAMVSRREPFVRFAKNLSRTFSLRPELKNIAGAATILCRCEDVTCGAVFAHGSWRASKLHTRCGMGPCQGRVCGAALTFLKGWSVDSVRPPLFPVNVSALAMGEAIQRNQHPQTQETA